jgi:hypothetical protein
MEQSMKRVVFSEKMAARMIEVPREFGINYASPEASLEPLVYAIGYMFGVWQRSGLPQKNLEELESWLMGNVHIVTQQCLNKR